MGYTSYLGLTTSSSSAGSAITFLQSRLSQFNDTNSNMTLIDSFASSVSGSISTLKVGQALSVNATFQSGTLYTANAALITSYSNYQLINLKLNATNGGVTTLQINSLAVITLKKVVNGSLTDLAASDLLAGTYNFFVYDGTYWVWCASGISVAGTNSWTGYNEFVGGIGYGVLTSTNNVTLDNTYHNVLVDATSGSRLVYLPSTVGIRREYTIKKIDSSSYVVQIVGSIDGSSTKNLSSQYSYLTIFADSSGSKWWDKS